METRDWITLVIIPALSALSAGVAGLWFWFTKSYLPAQQKRQEDLIQARILEQVDNREFKQQSETSSLNSLIDNQRMMTEALLKYTDSDLKEILTELKFIRGELQKLVGNSTLQTREWSRIEEILTDLDIMYHRVAGVLEGVIIGKDENS